MVVQAEICAFVSLYFMTKACRDCTTSNDFESYLMCCGVMLQLNIYIYIYIYIYTDTQGPGFDSWRV